MESCDNFAWFAELIDALCAVTVLPVPDMMHRSVRVV